MAIESATYISELVTTNPAAGDSFAANAGHLRLLKQVVQNSFPNVSGAVSASDVELSYLDGVTSGVQSQLNGKRSLSIETGKTTDFTAQAGKFYVLTAAASTRTMNLPASPSAGDMVFVVRAYTSGFNWTVSGNGSNIMGSFASVTITSSVPSYKFVYVDSTTGWAKFNS